MPSPPLLLCLARLAFRCSAETLKRFGEYASRMMAHCAEHGVTLYGHWASFPHGWARFQQGDIAGGLHAMRAALAAAASTHAVIFRPMNLAYLAEASVRAGQPEAGLGLLEEAISLAEQTGERMFEAELHRLRGELLLGSGHPDTVEKAYHQALAVAARQAARLWELRASVSLARLWRDQGKRTEARDLLAPVYGWFTEGFDSLDLREANALLGELDEAS